MFAPICGRLGVVFFYGGKTSSCAGVNYKVKECRWSKDVQVLQFRLYCTTQSQVYRFCVLAQVVGGYEKKKSIECIHYIREGKKKRKLISTI